MSAFDLSDWLWPEAGRASKPPVRGTPNADFSLTALWGGGQGVDDIVSGLPAALKAASAAATVLPVGPGIKVSGTAATERCVLPSLSLSAVSPGAGDFTAFATFRYDGGSAGAYIVIGRWSLTAAACEWSLAAGNTFGGSTADFLVKVGSTSYSASAASAAWVSGRSYSMVGRRKGATLYVDRMDLLTRTVVSGVVTNAGITSINSAPATPTQIGEITTGSGYNANISLALGGVARRSWDASEVAAYFANPFRLISPAATMPFGVLDIPVDAITVFALNAGATASAAAEAHAQSSSVQQASAALAAAAWGGSAAAGGLIATEIMSASCQAQAVPVSSWAGSVVESHRPTAEGLAGSALFATGMLTASGAAPTSPLISPSALGALSMSGEAGAAVSVATSVPAHVFQAVAADAEGASSMAAWAVMAAGSRAPAAPSSASTLSASLVGNALAETCPVLSSRVGVALGARSQADARPIFTALAAVHLVARGPVPVASAVFPAKLSEDWAPLALLADEWAPLATLEEIHA